MHMYMCMFLGYIVTLVLKGRICHFVKWQIQPFNTKVIWEYDEVMGYLDTLLHCKVCILGVRLVDRDVTGADKPVTSTSTPTTTQEVSTAANNTWYHLLLRWVARFDPFQQTRGIHPMLFQSLTWSARLQVLTTDVEVVVFPSYLYSATDEWKMCPSSFLACNFATLACFDSSCTKASLSIFHPLEFVDDGSETHLQVGKI